MGKIKIRLFPDGTIAMDTEGIKGKRCADYAKVLARLADAKINTVETTEEYYEAETLELNQNQEYN